jgi:hypothetical protein
VIPDPSHHFDWGQLLAGFYGQIRLAAYFPLKGHACETRRPLTGESRKASAEDQPSWPVHLYQMPKAGQHIVPKDDPFEIVNPMAVPGKYPGKRVVRLVLNALVKDRKVGLQVLISSFKEPRACSNGYGWQKIGTIVCLNAEESAGAINAKQHKESRCLSQAKREKLSD